MGVDADNGYRRYGVDQVRAGQLIGVLRGAGLSLEEIRELLDDLGHGPERAIARLQAHLTRAERHHAMQALVIRHVQATLTQGDDPMFEIQTRTVEARRFMSVQRRLHATDADAFVREAKATFAAHLGRRRATGPFTLIFHGAVSDEADGPLEATLACPADVVTSDTVPIRTEPAHAQAYTTITRAQWAYPAILAAYDAVTHSPQVRARPGSDLSCREVYLHEPDDVGDDEPLCDVAYPLGATARP